MNSKPHSSNPLPLGLTTIAQKTINYIMTED